MNEETIQKARVYAATINRRIADEVFTSTEYADHVTDKDKKRVQDENLRLAEEIERGEHDHNLTIAQRMHYYMTGKSLPLLP